MQVGMVPLTGTTNTQHMTEDLRADRFTLTPDELKHIETIGI
jgi:diketogulonate reductase-like aldo/keto reductase